VPLKAEAGLPWSFDEDDLYDDALPALTALREAGLMLAVMANQPSHVAAFLAGLPIDAAATSADWGLS